MIKYKSPYSDEETAVYLKHSTYANGGTPSMYLIDAIDHCPYMNCTVNLPGLASDELAIKNYSENEGLLEVLVDEGVLQEPHRYVESGYVMIPVCRRT